MRRTVIWLFCATGVLGLATLGSVGTSGQEVKAVPKEEPAKAVPKAVPRVAVNAAARAAADDAFVQQLEQQYGPHFRQMHRMEMHFMRLVCEPTKQQYEKIAADTGASMKAALRKFAEAFRGGPNDQYDPRAPITDAITAAVRANLSPDQAARYQKEIALRAEARKRLVVMNLVAMIDRAVILTPDQRTKLSEILANNWNESWNQTQLLINGGTYFPPMPDAKIYPVLTNAQWAVWRGISKGNVRFGVNVVFAQAVEIEDEVWEEDRPRKAPDRGDEKAAPKPQGPPMGVEKQ
jgi:hypothetical protein